MHGRQASSRCTLKESNCQKAAQRVQEREGTADRVSGSGHKRQSDVHRGGGGGGGERITKYLDPPLSAVSAPSS